MDEKYNGTLVAKIFGRPSTVDWGFVFIWLMAVVTVVGGGFWAGNIQYDEYVQIFAMKYLSGLAGTLRGISSSDNYFSIKKKKTETPAIAWSL